MRKLVLIFDGALAALGLVMALVQAVVCLLYAFVIDEAPRLAAQLPALIGSTAIFALLGAGFLAAFVSQLRQRAWRWPVQLLVVAALVPAGMTLYRLMT